MRLSELMPILLLLSIPAQLLGVAVFHLLAQAWDGRRGRAPQATIVPFKTVGEPRWTRR
jgi:hypothetical protein